MKRADGAADAATRSAITLEERSASGAASPAEPGLIAVFGGGQPQFRLLPLCDGAIVIGRTHGEPLWDDPLASRHHAEVRRDADAWIVRDLGSRNGTFVDGERVKGEPCRRGHGGAERSGTLGPSGAAGGAERSGTLGPSGAAGGAERSGTLGPSGAAGGAERSGTVVLRLGSTLYLAVDDLGPYREHGVHEREGAVVGPRLGQALARVYEAGAGTGSLLVMGESGAGKELAARTFHAAGGRDGRPFVAVNCATIPDGVAERLLFGSVRGAYSGATDAPGYIRAARGGTLFLDEVGELAPAVQAKLLRVLETNDLVPLGGTSPVEVSARFCFATLRNLRSLVDEQRFRADLFYRIARTTVSLPPLRQRTEEIATLVMRELKDDGSGPLNAHASLIEACLLRPWAGNVRELQSAVRHAVTAARRDGKSEVRASHLPPAEPAFPPTPEVPTPQRAAVDPDSITPEALRAALAAHHGNVAAAARGLGLHRSQIYRLLERYAIDRDA